MQTWIFYLLVVIGPPFAGPPQGMSTEIRAEAQPASVELTPLADEDRPVRLPPLAFALRIEPSCAGATEPLSLSISAADTRLHFKAADLAAAPVVEATLTIPQKQLGPLRIDGFCRAGQDDPPSRLLLEDAYTARLSLRCGSDDEQTIVYATLALDVNLLCRRADTAELAADQDPASPEPSESF